MSSVTLAFFTNPTREMGTNGVFFLNAASNEVPKDTI